MPQVSFYLRVEDLDKWANLKNKAEFIHNALNKNPTGGVILNSSVPKPPKSNKPKSSVSVENKIEKIKAMVPGMLTAADLAPKIEERGLCKKCTSILDTRGKCMNKGCK